MRFRIVASGAEAQPKLRGHPKTDMLSAALKITLCSYEYIRELVAKVPMRPSWNGFKLHPWLMSAHKPRAMSSREAEPS